MNNCRKTKILTIKQNPNKSSSELARHDTYNHTVNWSPYTRTIQRDQYNIMLMRQYSFKKNPWVLYASAIDLHIYTMEHTGKVKCEMLMCCYIMKSTRGLHYATHVCINTLTEHVCYLLLIQVTEANRFTGSQAQYTNTSPPT